MVQYLRSFGARFFAGMPEPWHYLFTGKYDRKSHARWARQPRWITGLQIFGALILYAMALAVIAYIAWAVATNIW